MKKGPGKRHRRGITLRDLFRMFPDDDTAERHFMRQRWPDGPYCPYCSSANVLSGAKHKTMPFRCREKSCRKRFSVRTGTVMEASNIGYQNWAIAIYLLMTSLKSVSSMKLSRGLGITQKSAWFLAHRLREAWKKKVEDPFLCPAEVDETYMGGQRKNMARSKRKHMTGRGAVGKTVVVGVKDRRTNCISAAVVEGTDARTLKAFIKDRVTHETKIFTDDLVSYVGIIADHDTVNHSSGEYVRGEVHTNGIESFWSMLKRAHKGTFHNINAKHMDRYVTEFAGRHNMCDLDTGEQMSELMGGMIEKRLRYRDLIS